MFNTKMLDEYLAEAGMTKKEFCRKIGISENRLKRLREGKMIRDSVSILIIISGELDVRVDDLIGMVPRRLGLTPRPSVQ